MTDKEIRLAARCYQAREARLTISLEPRVFHARMLPSCNLLLNCSRTQPQSRHHRFARLPQPGPTSPLVL
jgi:hypothetical protein